MSRDADAIDGAQLTDRLRAAADLGVGWVSWQHRTEAPAEE